MTWMTCQPKADLTGSSSDPAARPGFMIALQEGLVDRAGRVEVRELAAGPGRAARARLVALGAGDRVEERRVGLDLVVGRAGLGLGGRPRRIVVGDVAVARGADGSSLGEYRMWRTLMLSAGRSSAAVWIQISLTSRCGPGFVASATTLSSSFWWMTSPATTVAVLLEVDAVVLELARCRPRRRSPGAISLTRPIR